MTGVHFTIHQMIVHGIAGVLMRSPTLEWQCTCIRVPPFRQLAAFPAPVCRGHLVDKRALIARTTIDVPRARVNVPCRYAILYNYSMHGSTLKKVRHCRYAILYNCKQRYAIVGTPFSSYREKVHVDVLVRYMYAIVGTPSCTCE